MVEDGTGERPDHSELGAHLAQRPDARVLILMATYNGAQHLTEQLNSLSQQSHRDWRLWVSDDGSSDETRNIVARYAAKQAEHGRDVRLIDGPGRGGTANFLSLLEASQPAAEELWIAFSDQDDVWLPDKLARGIAALEGIDGPALYCSRTWIADAGLTQRRLSAPRPLPPSFANALVQNIAAGNTILLNPAAAALACAAAAEAGEVVVHDWWLYQLITGAGGRVVHDDVPGLLYRQHGRNEIGANDTWRARAKRVRQLLWGDFQDWNRLNSAALERSAHRLTPEARAMLADFAGLGRAGLLRRLAGLRGLGLYRQSRPAQAALWLAAVLGRL